MLDECLSEISVKTYGNQATADQDAHMKKHVSYNRVSMLSIEAHRSVPIDQLVSALKEIGGWPEFENDRKPMLASDEEFEDEEGVMKKSSYQTRHRWVPGRSETQSIA